MIKRPPKKCQVPELWWFMHRPVIVYPNGEAEIWSQFGDSSYWYEHDLVYWPDFIRHPYLDTEFICELK